MISSLAWPGWVPGCSAITRPNLIAGARETMLGSAVGLAGPATPGARVGQRLVAARIEGKMPVGRGTWEIYRHGTGTTRRVMRGS